ncbi:MAG: peptidylprolyl isomerase [Prevotella sp.]|nr:peptidylprolyl isomerase [Candidatus Prevotella equi]
MIGIKKIILCSITTLCLAALTAVAADDTKTNYIDEILWVVGDEAILRSDVEVMRMQAEENGITWDGDPECRIPEQIAVQKLFINQAEIDSIEVTEAEISQAIDQQINGWAQMIGSREKLEEYRKQTIAQMKAEMHDDFKNRELAQRMRKKLVEDVAVTPAEVREFFKTFPEDSIPFVPATVEVQIITIQPKIPIEDINKVKDELREYTERVQSGSTSFATLARLYSEDEGSARQGGELGYTGRSILDPSFAQVAFNLTDPKKVSKIVESEFGFHIIQLIDRRGDKVNCRHILRKPKVSQSAIAAATERMDSIVDALRKGEFPFEEGATFISDDKDTKNNKGLMSNITEEGRTSHFQMKDLPTEVARAVDTMKVGDISKPFTMINSRGKTVVATVKLKSKTEGHKATITEDFQILSNIVLERQREKVIKDWVQKKIKNTYVRMDERYKNGDFEFEGWER